MMAHVEPVLELGQVRRQVLLRDMDMSAGNAALQLRPKAFKAVHMGNAFDVLASAMLNRVVSVSLGILRMLVKPTTDYGGKQATHYGMKPSGGAGS